MLLQEKLLLQSFRTIFLGYFEHPKWTWYIAVIRNPMLILFHKDSIVLEVCRGNVYNILNILGF